MVGLETQLLPKHVTSLRDDVPRRAVPGKEMGKEGPGCNDIGKQIRKKATTSKIKS